MKTRLIPETVKSWFRKRIKNVTSQGQFTDLRYLSHQHGIDSFKIPKSPKLPDGTCNQGFAIPGKDMWLGYGNTGEEFLAMGREDVDTMLKLVDASDFALSDGDRILDFGCASGRMIRHLDTLPVSCEIWGTDICAEMIYWCRQNLSPPFHFATTTTAPHLPFEDQYFNLIYAGSVFTHLEELAEAWLLELRRILSPNGRLYFTIHDNHTIQLLDGPWKDSNLGRKVRACNPDDSWKTNMGMFVMGRATAALVFYDTDYFKQTLGSMFHVLSMTEEAYGPQTAVLVKRT